MGQLAEVRPHLNELQWRLLLGAQARSLGRGGIKRVAQLTGVHPDTVGRGARELEQGIEPDGRVRRAGAGRPQAVEVDAGLVPALRRLVGPGTRGDPESPLRWTTKSTERLAGDLALAWRPASPDTVGRLLKEDGYSLQGNAKTVEGKQHPDRDGQFRFINEQVREFQAAGQPVISVDTKKKELVGNYKNGGKEWRPRGEPERVEVHDFKGELGRAVPYGVYDMTANAGWVNVGTDADTGAFAVESIRRWWQQIRQAALDTGTYEKGIKISDQQMKALEQRSIRRHAFHGEWNYTLLPARQPTHPTSQK